MTQILADKDMKMVITSVFQMFKKLSRNMGSIRKDLSQIQIKTRTYEIPWVDI